MVVIILYNYDKNYYLLSIVILIHTTDSSSLLFIFNIQIK